MLSDTHPDADKVQIEVLRAMPVWRKLATVSELSLAARKLALAGLRQSFPSATPAELDRRLATLYLGPELATEVYGPSPVRPRPSEPARRSDTGGLPIRECWSPVLGRRLVRQLCSWGTQEHDGRRPGRGPETGPGE